MADHAWMSSHINGQTCIACGVERSHQPGYPTVYYRRVGFTMVQLDSCPPCEPVPSEADKFHELYATLPECRRSGCGRKATLRLVNRPTVLCDEHAEALSDDEWGTWRTEEFNWAHIVREQEGRK